MKEEDSVAACMALLGWIQVLMAGRAQNRDHQVAFALYDLATKARSLPPAFRHQFVVRAIDAVAKGSATSRLKDAIQRIGEMDGGLIVPAAPPKAVIHPSTQRLHVDVFIVTVINVEKTAALKAFGIDAEAADRAQAFIDIHNRRCYRAQVPASDRRRGKRDLRVYITVVGEARNVPCANVCRDIMESVDVDLFMLVGIGGGNEDLAKQGDVIGALGVFYMEGGKRRLISVEPPQRTFVTRYAMAIDRFFGAQVTERSEPIVKVDPEIVPATLLSPAKEYLLDFEPKKTDRVTHFRNATTRYSSDDWPPGEHKLSENFGYHRGFVMCGEKVLVDDSVVETAGTINRKVACVDMESYGFASTCAHKDKNWLVFRGISDFANPKKDDAQHVSASVAAAVTARLFLAESYIESDARGTSQF